MRLCLRLLICRHREIRLLLVGLFLILFLFRNLLVVGSNLVLNRLEVVVYSSRIVVVVVGIVLVVVVRIGLVAVMLFGFELALLMVAFLEDMAFVVLDIGLLVLLGVRRRFLFWLVGMRRLLEMGGFLHFAVVPLFRCRIYLLFAFELFYLKLSCYCLGFVVFIFILLSINSSTSFLRMNSSGWKSLSILSTRASSSRLTNLLNSVRREREVLFNFSRSCFIWAFSCLIAFISSSVSWRDEIRFFPRRRTRSLINLFRSSVSFNLVLKSDKRNLIWASVSCGCVMIMGRFQKFIIV